MKLHDHVNMSCKTDKWDAIVADMHIRALDASSRADSAFILTIYLSSTRTCHLCHQFVLIYMLHGMHI